MGRHRRWMGGILCSHQNPMMGDKTIKLLHTDILGCVILLLKELLCYISGLWSGSAVLTKMILTKEITFVVQFCQWLRATRGEKRDNTTGGWWWENVCRAKVCFFQIIRVTEDIVAVKSPEILSKFCESAVLSSLYHCFHLRRSVD